MHAIRIQPTVNSDVHLCPPLQVGDALLRSITLYYKKERSSGPSRKECAVNDKLTKASNIWVPPPPPPCISVSAMIYPRTLIHISTTRWTYCKQSYTLLTPFPPSVPKAVILLLLLRNHSLERAGRDHRLHHDAVLTCQGDWTKRLKRPSGQEKGDRRAKRPHTTHGTTGRKNIGSKELARWQCPPR